jgi:hypothetical protein
MSRGRPYPRTGEGGEPAGQAGEGAMVGPMAYSWIHLDGEGRGMGRSGPYGGRDEAEAWLTASWEELAASGVMAVALVEEGGTEVYRMSLEPEG